MLMLRQGGKFTDQQIRKYLRSASLWFGLAMAAVVATPYIPVPFVGLFVTLFALAVLKKKFEKWGNWSVGKRGELAVQVRRFGIG